MCDCLGTHIILILTYLLSYQDVFTEDAFIKQIGNQKFIAS